MSDNETVDGEVTDVTDEVIDVSPIPGEFEPVEITDEIRAMFLPEHPSGVQCIDVVRHMSFNLGNVIQFIWNDGLPGYSVDLPSMEKAMWYLQDEINAVRAEEDRKRADAEAEQEQEQWVPSND